MAKAKKTAKGYRLPKMQTLTLREITDPAEQAAIDARLKQCERAMAGVPDAATVKAVLEFCRRLSAEEKFGLAVELATGLPPKQRSKLQKRLSSQRPAPATAVNGRSVEGETVKPPHYQVGDRVRVRPDTELIGEVFEARGADQATRDILYRVRVPKDPEVHFLLVTEEAIEPVAG
jgi:hypothetical protein